MKILIGILPREKLYLKMVIIHCVIGLFTIYNSSKDETAFVLFILLPPIM